MPRLCLQKLCLNGHEWAKRQLERGGIRYEALDNGFLSCTQPEKLQQICDSLGPEEIDRVFRKWLRRVPLPLRAQDQRPVMIGRCPSVEWR